MQPIPWAHIRRSRGATYGICGAEIYPTEFAFEDVGRAVFVYANAKVPPRACPECVKQAPQDVSPPAFEWGSGILRR